MHGICADFSTNIVLRGVELRNTGNWATRFFDCANLFERVKATGIGMSICAYADPTRLVALAMSDCDISFGSAQTEFIRGADIECVELSGVRVKGVDGPCVRTWSGTPDLRLSDVIGLENTVEKSDKPFKTPAI